MAIEQLAPYAKAAVTWPITKVGREHRCGVCDQNIWFSADQGGNQFLYTPDMIMGVKTAHIRQVHSEIVNGHDTQAS